MSSFGPRKVLGSKKRDGNGVEPSVKILVLYWSAKLLNLSGMLLNHVLNLIMTIQTCNQFKTHDNLILQQRIMIVPPPHANKGQNNNINSSNTTNNTTTTLAMVSQHLSTRFWSNFKGRFFRISKNTKKEHQQDE